MNAEIKTRIEMINKGEIPEGYKKTKVGIIPEDWEVKRLEKVSKITMGQSPSSKNYNENNIGLPLVQGNADIKDRYTSPRLFTSEITKTCDIDDIIMSVRAPVGEIAKSVHKACIGRGVCSIRPVDNNNYLYHYLISNERLWTTYSQGSTFESVNSSDIKKFRVISPRSKSEQQKIAQILSTWDEVINLKEKLIEQKKDQKKGLMQKLLTGEVRLPGFDGEWEEVRLGEVVNRVVEKNNGKSNNVLTISAEDGLISQELYFNKQIASKNLDNYIYLVNGDFAYNKSYSSGYPMGAIKMLEKYEEGIVSSLYICFRPRKKVSRSYLKQYFDGNMFNHEIFKIAQEGARNHGLLNIGIGDFFNIKLNLPPLQEQKAIAQILSTADKEIDLLKEELEQLKLQKKGLMQLLLTGIIRVKS